MGFTLAKKHLYKWRPGRTGSFKNLLTFAWFMMIENEREGKKIQTALFLNFILLAARTRGLNNKYLPELAHADWILLELALHNGFISDETRTAALCFLIQCLILLNDEGLSPLNAVEIAMFLEAENQKRIASIQRN